MEESLLHGVSSDLKAWKGLQFIHILSLSLTHSLPTLLLWHRLLTVMAGWI